MKKMLVILVLIMVVPTFALAAAKTYQVTGPVLEVSDTLIVVQKGKDRWEIARDQATNVTGDLKVGSKVTIEYRMTATKVEVKESKKAAKEEKKPAPAKEEKKPAAPAVK